MRVFILLSALVLLSACNNLAVTTVTLPNGAKITAEIADTPKLTERGLMHRKKLPVDRGMLFVFDKEGDRVFWMKNTFIPLDMIFMGEDKVIKCIFDNVPASTPFTPLEEVAMAGCEDSMYVLEVYAGVSEHHNLQVNQRLEF